MKYFNTINKKLLLTLSLGCLLSPQPSHAILRTIKNMVFGKQPTSMEETEALVLKALNETKYPMIINILNNFFEINRMLSHRLYQMTNLEPTVSHLQYLAKSRTLLEKIIFQLQAAINGTITYDNLDDLLTISQEVLNDKSLKSLAEIASPIDTEGKLKNATIDIKRFQLTPIDLQNPFKRKPKTDAEWLEYAHDILVKVYNDSLVINNAFVDHNDDRNLFKMKKLCLKLSSYDYLLSEVPPTENPITVMQHRFNCSREKYRENQLKKMEKQALT